MTPEPNYESEHLKVAYQLRYIWTGWPSQNRFPDEPDAEFFEELEASWETDGIRLLEREWTPQRVRILASVKPSVAPVFFAGRMKGRLQYALRKNEAPVQFSRKLAVRSIGENCTATVQNYVSGQVEKEPLADPKFKEFLEQFTLGFEAVDLAEPTASTSGRYWYNLHLVLVVRDRFRLTKAAELRKLRDGALRIAELKGHLTSWLSVMPDHLHVVLRGNIEHSPEAIALNYMNNLAYLLRQDALWQPSCYLGTFGEYTMGAIRKAVAGS